MATDEKTTIAKAPRGRVRRTPVGTRSRLGVRNKDPKFVYRIVNDLDGRVDQFIEAGYEVCNGDETIGDSRVNLPKKEGSPVSTSVGGGVKGVLMRIPKEWYEEDQQAKQEFVNEKESVITESASDGKYGKITTKYS